MFDHNRFPRWMLVTLDKRGSINLPASFKNNYGVGPNFNFLMRPLGDCFLCIPPSRLPLTAETERELDFAAVEYSNRFWTASPKENGPVLSPPLFDGDAVSNPLAASLPASRRGVATADLRKVVTVNKKGFVPIPDSLKDAMGLEIETNVMVELVQHEQYGRILILVPMETSSTAWSEYVQQKQQAHLEEERLEQRKEQLRQQIAALATERNKIHTEITDMAKVREVLQDNIKELNGDRERLAKGMPPKPVVVMSSEKPPNGLPAAPSFGVVAKPEPTTPEPSEEVQILERRSDVIMLIPNPAPPTQAAGDLKMSAPMGDDQPPKDIPLQEGHKWQRNSFFGWIQVPDVE